MHYHKIIFFLSLFILMGCGKSPLLNKIKKNTSEFTGSILLTEEFPNEKNTFSFKWITPPGLVDLSSFEVNTTSPLKDNQSFKAYLWMPEMGHGSSPIEIQEISQTNYIFSELAFIMRGLWVLHIEILENNQVVDQWQKSIVL